MVVGPLTSFRRATPDFSAVAPQAVLRGLAAQALADRPRWPLWLPVGFGTGIGLYFALPFEPSATRAVAIGLVGIASAVFCVAIRELGFADRTGGGSGYRVRVCACQGSRDQGVGTGSGP